MRIEVDFCDPRALESLAKERLPGRPHYGAAHEADQRPKITTQPPQMLCIDLSQRINQQSGVGAW